jgi:hypothetical protein
MNPTSSGFKKDKQPASYPNMNKTKSTIAPVSVRKKETRREVSTINSVQKISNRSASAENISERNKRKATDTPPKTNIGTKRKMLDLSDQSNESLTNMQTDDPSILSVSESDYRSDSYTNDNIKKIPPKNSKTTSQFKSKNSNDSTNYARIDLNSPESLANLPQNTRQVLISSSDENITLAKLNPFRIQQEIDSICNEVENVEHCKSGSLLVTTKTIEQVHTLLKLKHFTANKIPVTSVIAWSKQLSYGKLFAPEFQEDSLQYLLTIMKEQGVVSICKLFSDPQKAKVPLYVLTFFGTSCPPKIKIGYCIYNIDKYYPSPQRCNKCCRWGHSSAICRSDTNCSKCGKKGHTQNECTANTTSCINCKQIHNVCKRMSSISERTSSMPCICRPSYKPL